jgi:Domain of unknown function (DUF4407)
MGRSMWPPDHRGSTPGNLTNAEWLIVEPIILCNQEDLHTASLFVVFVRACAWSNVMARRSPKRRSFLWWIAGADQHVLAECPRADQVFIQHLGISLIGAFVFVFAITAISIQIAFSNLADSILGTLLGFALAFLIAAMVFLVDRLFIQSDWDWQASKQKREMARWKQRNTRNDAPSVKLPELRWGRRAGRFVARIIVISFRILLSVAIGLTIASFLELVIYKGEITSLIQQRDYTRNKLIYREVSQYTDQLDHEIDRARQERNRLATLKARAEDEVSNAALAAPLERHIPSTADIDRQIAALQKKIAVENENTEHYAEVMAAELHGTKLFPGNSGVPGAGARYKAAEALKDASDTTIANYKAQIRALEADKTRVLERGEAEYQKALEHANDQKNALHQHLAEISATFAQAQSRLLKLESTRQPAMNKYVNDLKKKPGFVPIAFGIANQFQALRALYAKSGSTFEMVMIKFLIVMIEMTPVLQKVFFSPPTLYAVKLDAARREGEYEAFSKEERLRRELTQYKLSSTVGEAFDGKGIQQVGRGKVTPLHANAE